MPTAKPVVSGSRLMAGLITGALGGGVAWLLHAFLGVGGPTTIAIAAAAGFLIGYVLGLFVVEVLLEIVS